MSDNEENECPSGNSTPTRLKEKADIVKVNLLPAKSKERYINAYNANCLNGRKKKIHHHFQKMYLVVIFLIKLENMHHQVIVYLFDG